MYSKALEGRDEEILFPEIPIIDAHTHLFDNQNYRYLFDDYLQDARAGHNIVASVCIEIQAFARTAGPKNLRALGEIEFLNGMGAIGASGRYGKCQVAAAIVGHADLREGDSIAEFLDLALAYAPNRFRGVRQVAIEHHSELPYRYITHRPPKGVLDSPGLIQGLRQLGRRNLSFDAAVFHTQLPQLATLATTCPDTIFILNHIGLPMLMGLDGARRSELIQDWRISLKALARHPNVACKIGGLGMPFFEFNFIGREMPVTSVELAASWKPFVEAVIEAFGPRRCMMESNFPPDGRSCGYVPLWNALKLCVAGYSTPEKEDMFCNTAARIYRISLERQSDKENER